MLRVVRVVVVRALLIAGIGVLVGGPRVADLRAQEATPPAGEVVSPEECTTAGRPVTFLRDLIATPVAAATPAPITALPPGGPPDAATRAAVEAAVRQIVACSNLGDVLRGLALFSDDYLRRTIDPTGAMTPDEALELLAPFATPIALGPDALVRLVEVRELRLLPDGAVAAVVVTDGGIPDPPGLAVDLFIFRAFDGVWLVDEAVSPWEGGEASATPEGSR